MFDPNDFNGVAADLVNGEAVPSPACIRTAVGRSYYSQYGFLKHRLEQNYSGSFGDKGWHSQLCLVCSESTQKGIRKIGKALEHLWELRRDADYFPNREVTLTEAQGAVDLAVKCHERIRNLGDNDLHQIHAELQLLIAHVEAGTRRRL